jgi:hypothetical protein
MSDTEHDVPGPSTGPAPNLELLVQRMQDLRDQLHDAHNRIQALESTPHPDPSTTIPAPPPARATPVIKVAKPDDYDGSPANVEKFLHQCNLYLASETFSDRQKIIFALSYMKLGRALPWAEMKLEQLNAGFYLGHSWTTLQKDIRDAFGDTDRKATAQVQLATIVQGKTTVDDFNVRFDAVATLTDFNDAAKMEYYKKGLKDAIRHKINTMPKDKPTTTREWQQLASNIDRDYREDQIYNLTRPNQSSTPFSKGKDKRTLHTIASSTPKPSHTSHSHSHTTHSTTASPAPQKIKSEPVDAKIAAQRKEQGLCIKCGSSDHWANMCPLGTSSPSSTSSRSGFRGRGRNRGRGGSNSSRHIRNIETGDSKGKEQAIFELSSTGVDKMSAEQKAALSSMLKDKGF